MTGTVCQVTFRGVKRSTALERLIRERAEWLQQFAPDLETVRAVVDAPHRHHAEHAFRVQLRMAIRDSDHITIDREGAGDAYALVRDTYDIARRCLQDRVREQRGFVKTHVERARRVV